MALTLGAALLGSAVIGGVSQAVSGKKAAKAQIESANQQIAEWRRQYDTTRADQAPWRETGAAALGKLGGLYGLGTPGGGPTGGTTGEGAYGGFFTSPGYQFRLDEGVKAAERSAASRGLLKSGAAMKAIQRYGEGLASSEYGNFVGGLAGLAGVGQAATQATAQAGNAATQGITGAQQQIGNARASSYANTGSAINGGINNVLSAYLFNQGGGFKGFG